jgi:SAM-dependent methyltransferase
MARMYDELAPWYHLITAPKSYEPEARLILSLLRDDADGELSSLLELGCGGGNNASHLKAHLDLTLADLSPHMLEQSRRLNPECEHLEGDMRTLRLGRSFDAVLVHDAVCHLLRPEDLAAAIATVAAHLRPGGAAVFAPDHTRETFASTQRTGGHDGEDGRSVRYLEWSWDPDPEDTTYLSCLAYILRDADGLPRFENDTLEMGLFPRSAWEGFFEDEGLQHRRVRDEWGREETSP